MTPTPLKAAAVLLVLTTAGCVEETGPSTAAPERLSVGQMPAFCRGEASARFGERPQDIVTLPAEPDQGMFTVPGQYPQGNPTTFFNCTFTADGQLVGVDLV